MSIHCSTRFIITRSLRNSMSMSSSNPESGEIGGEFGAAVAPDSASTTSSSSLSTLSTSGPHKKRKASVQMPAGKTTEEEKWDRVLANRRSAKESRERRKQLLSDLEESVEKLKKDNSGLSAENANLRTQLQIALASNNRTAAEATLAGAANPHLARSIAAGLLLRGPSTIAAPAAPTMLAGGAQQQHMMNANNSAAILAALASAMGAPNAQSGAALAPAGPDLSSALAQLTALQQQSQPQQQLNTSVGSLHAQALAQQQQQQATSTLAGLSGALSLATRSSSLASTTSTGVHEEQKQQG